MAPSARQQQEVKLPIGRPFTSPKKKNRHKNIATSRRVILPESSLRSRYLRTRLAALDSDDDTARLAVDREPGPLIMPESGSEMGEVQHSENEAGVSTEDNDDGVRQDASLPRKRRLVPDEAAV